jgi:beta-lactamase superfamily II metal-dependent hydrolase
VARGPAEVGRTREAERGRFRREQIRRRAGCVRTNTDVIAPPTDAEGGLFAETNDNSVGILLTYGTARVLLAGDAEAKSDPSRLRRSGLAS